MRELILSDITVMGQGYCVIGLERIGPERFRSVRPMPPTGYAWREPFPYKRGDCVRFRPTTAGMAPAPHVEDQPCAGLEAAGRTLDEGELIASLRKAEVAVDLEHLFGCEPRASTRGGKAVWVSSADARRSICGCEYHNIWFRIYVESEDFKLRARLSLGANERLESIPVVDRDWREFATRLIESSGGLAEATEAERVLNHAVRPRLLASPHRFLRIGLPRPSGDELCWLMLDSLFPQPRNSWLPEP